MPATIKLPRRSKYGVRLDEAGRIARTYNDVLYDSRAEANYAASLDVRVKIGELIAWWRQIAFTLVVNGVKIGKLTIDFKLLHAEDLRIEYVEIKGAVTRDYALRVKLFRALFPEEKLTVIPAKEYR